MSKKVSVPPGSLAMVLASVAYLLVMHFLTGLRPEHGGIILLLNGLWFWGKKSRQFVLGFAIFAVFGILYDVMRAFPNYQFRPVDIEGLYRLEKAWFGIGEGAGRLTPNEYFNVHNNAAGDLLGGIFYLTWVPVPLAFAAWLFYFHRRLFLDFSLTFLLVNILGFAIYYIHPAAPPWYVALHGFDFHPDTPGNTAGLIRFDQLVGSPVFQSIYQKNANVFAAVPSLHCAYPVIVLYYALRTRIRLLPLPLTVIMAGIWFAAVYSGHHYVIDVLLGVFCAVAGIFLYRQGLLRSGAFTRFREGYIRLLGGNVSP